MFKFKKRKGYKKTQGHRQNLTRIQIESIGGKKATAKKAPAKAAAKDASAEKTADKKPAAKKTTKAESAE